jgi:hypothetical protein
MDFTDYKAKLASFESIFNNLNFFPTWERIIGHENLKNFKKSFTSAMRDKMTNPPEGEEGNPSNFFLPLSVDSLTTLKDINLAADLESVTLQAEAVKRQIIEIKKRVTIPPQKFDPELWTEDPTPQSFKITDFIRNSHGKIVYPFDYWNDCVEVYLRKHLLGNSNEMIAKYNFKTQRENATKRAKLKLIADMLEEIKVLIEVVKSKTFPPKVLNGTKQPSMIIEGE